MTKKLEDLLNLPDSKEIIEQAEDQEAERRQRTQAESDWRLRGLLQGEKGAHTDPAGATMCALLFGCSVPS